ncbi:MAG: MATE family efflux transporter, partial [Planctomycetota bacterium]
MKPAADLALDTDESVSSDANTPPTTPELPELGGKLAGLSLGRQVVVLAVWPFLELLLNALVSIVDTALAGRIDERSLDAIGVAAYVGWLLGMLHTSLGVGASALIARAKGGDKRRHADAALGQALFLAAVWGAATAGVVAAAAPWIAAIFSLPPTTHDLAVVYLRVVAVGATLGSVLIVGNACLRAAGDTRTPFVVMVGVNVVNIAASWLFTFGPEPFGGYGVAGIAAGTAVAWSLGGVVVLAVLLHGRLELRLYPRWMRPKRDLSGRIVRVGLPSLIESSGMWLGNAIIGGFVGVLIAKTATDGLMGAHI